MIKTKPIVLTIFEEYNYQRLMGDIDATFIVYNCRGSKPITGALPKNHYIINDLTPDIRPDILLSQNQINQYNILQKMQTDFMCPIISLWHNLPKNEKEVHYAVNNKNNTNIFMSADHAKAWQVSMDYTIIEPCPYRNITKITEPLIYVNKNTTFNGVFDVLDQMAIGACVISPAVFEINNVIKQAHSGFLYHKDDYNKEKELIKKISTNDDLVMEVGYNAQIVVKEKFSKQNFTKKWNDIINANIYK